ncbi:TIGR02569 family protein [uncultured Corynebacterium sp.]|mgnify:FL=1|uniref:TIGR02569 family protein n=1 Tax=uncultured Corynebacterium sp. TaxID=159447 RepID=UPI002633A9D1|nr:TIGR02569 family protein [uncultured Corynebacterium sp.]
MTRTPPPHVLEAFGVSGGLPEPAGPAWDDGWVYGEVVVSAVADASRAAWSAKMCESLAVDGVRVAHPVRTSDGRHVLAGWRARQHVPGRPEIRPDETLVACTRLEAALADVERPRFLAQAGTTVFDVCDRAAWADDPVPLLEQILDPGAVPREDEAEALSLAAGLLGLRGELRADGQLVHGDPVGTMVFDGSAPAVVTDLVPRWHPEGWTPAVAAIDYLAWGGADDDLLDRFDHIGAAEDAGRWNALLTRAIVHRLFLHAVHPDSNVAAWRGLARAAELMKARL